MIKDSGRSRSTLPSSSSDPQPLEDDVAIIEDRQSEKPPRHPSSTSSKPSAGTSDFAKCNYCDALIGCASGNRTTPLKNHTKRCKRLPSNLDKKQKMLDVETRTVVGANDGLKDIDSCVLRVRGLVRFCMENKKVGLPNEEDWRKVSSILCDDNFGYDNVYLR
ncbi:hypothetical protein V2J09_003593 [Rumex salicifolius]